MKIVNYITAAALILVTIAGCDNKAVEQKVTKEEALMAAEKLESSVAARRADYLNKFIDENVFSERITNSMGSSISAKEKRNLTESVIDGLKRSGFGSRSLVLLIKKVLTNW